MKAFRGVYLSGNIKRELGSIFFAFRASDLGWGKDLHEVKDQRFLGPEEFMEEIQGGRQERVSRVYKISLEDMIEAIEGQFKIRRSLVYSSSRNREGALGRSLVAYFGRRWAGYSLRVVADHFARDPVVISVGVKRLEERLGVDRCFSHRVEILEKNLIRNKKVIKVDELVKSRHSGENRSPENL